MSIDCVAIVAGGASGLGEAISHRLAAVSDWHLPPGAIVARHVWVDTDVARATSAMHCCKGQSLRIDWERDAHAQAQPSQPPQQ